MTSTQTSRPLPLSLWSAGLLFASLTACDGNAGTNTRALRAAGDAGGLECGPVCGIFCEYGNVLDENGCPTCACQQPPTCSSSDDCAAGQTCDLSVCRSPCEDAPEGTICPAVCLGECRARPEPPQPPPTCSLDDPSSCGEGATCACAVDFFDCGGPGCPPPTETCGCVPIPETSCTLDNPVCESGADCVCVFPGKNSTRGRTDIAPGEPYPGHPAPAPEPFCFCARE